MANKEKETGELKKRAWLAKQRLKMGYWQSVGNEDAPAPAIARRDARYDKLASATQARDDKMYRRVCDILDSDEVTSNPIGQLIDGEVYSKLDPTGKQRYILELSNKFRELQERYYRERASKSS